MERLYYSVWESPVGALTIVVSERGLVALEFGGRKPSRHRAELVQSSEKTEPYRRELGEYFAGLRQRFTIALDLRGTDFQLRCWHALLGIPYGETRSYADIARAVGKPRAFRAVGLANNRNPIPIIVPCHRVIASNGSLCGYGGGLDIKEKLLRLETASASARHGNS